MADHVLERRVWLPRPRAEVFAFFADARNLALVNSPTGRLRWLTPPPPTLAAGAVIDFSIRAGGLPLPWRVFVREFDPPHRFVEVPPAEGTGGPVGTWVEDRVTYRLPLGPLGRLAHALGVERWIAGVFDYRERRLREVLGEGAAAPPAAGGRRGPGPVTKRV